MLYCALWEDGRKSEKSRENRLFFQECAIMLVYCRVIAPTGARRKRMLNLLKGNEIKEALGSFNKRVVIAVSVVALLIGSMPGLAGLVARATDDCIPRYVDEDGEIIVTHEVSYDVNGGSVDAEGRVVQLPVDDCAKATMWTPVKPSDMTKFLGWFNGDKEFVFDTPITSDLNLVAQYSNDAIVYFHSADSEMTIIDSATQNVTLGASVIASTSEYVGSVTGKVLTGWRDGADGTIYELGDSVIVGAAEVHLYPVFTDSAMIMFNAQGGSAVVPQIIAQGGKATVPAQPTRAGYTFKHWSTSVGGASAYDFSKTVDDGDLTLYAVWTPKTVNYTVSVWVQDPNDTTKYVSAGSCSSTATAGTSVPPSGGTWLTGRGCSEPSYATFNAVKSVPVVISGTGTSIVNVYYDLTEYILTFNLSNGSMTIGGKTYTSSTTPKYSISVRVGQDISSIWPYTGIATFSRSGYNFNGWNPPNTISASQWVTKRPVFTPEMVGTYSLDILWVSTSVSATVVNYWVEAPQYSSANCPNSPTGTWTTRDGKCYQKSDEYSQVTYSSCPSPKEIYGMDKGAAAGSGCNLYYNRMRYTLKFDPQNGSEVTTHDKVWYQQVLDGLVPSTPTREGYVFLGWFYGSTDATAAELQEGDKMPAGDKTLYAKWAPDKYLAQFYMTKGGAELTEFAQHFDGSMFIAEPTWKSVGEEVYDGEGNFVGQFDGWYYDITGPDGKPYSMPFSFEATYEDSLEIYARYKTQGFTVEYNVDGGGRTDC